jgi:hypothetical protein
MAHFKTDWKAGVVLSINTPSLRQEAWDAAVANQAVTWMPDEQLQRYVTAYADIRAVQALSTIGGTNFIDGPRMLNTLSDLETDEATPHDMLRVLSQIRSGYSNVDGNLQSLLNILPKADTAVASAH